MENEASQYEVLLGAVVADAGIVLESEKKVLEILALHENEIAQHAQVLEQIISQILKGETQKNSSLLVHQERLQTIEIEARSGIASPIAKRSLLKSSLMSGSLPPQKTREEEIRVVDEILHLPHLEFSIFLKADPEEFSDRMRLREKLIILSALCSLSKESLSERTKENGFVIDKINLKIVVFQSNFQGANIEHFSPTTQDELLLKYIGLLQESLNIDDQNTAEPIDFIREGVIIDQLGEESEDGTLVIPIMWYSDAYAHILRDGENVQAIGQRKRGIAINALSRKFSQLYQQSEFTYVKKKRRSKR